jgi:serine/threonine-protein kinase
VGQETALFPVAPSDLRPVQLDSRRDRILQFINNYELDLCFSISSVEAKEGSATIIGYGSSVEPFNNLDKSFRKSLGFEADIGARLITKAQCPVLAFLNNVRSDASVAPKLEINAPSLRSGQALTGSVTIPGGRQIQVLLVNDDGVVQNITNLVRTGGIRTFNILLERAAGGDARPQLVIAITSGEALASLQTTRSPRADRFFPALEAEAKTKAQKLGISVSYFQLE